MKSVQHHQMTGVGVRENIHLILALGREEPCCKSHGNNYHEANDDTPPARLGVSQERTVLWWCAGLSRTRWPFCRSIMRDDLTASIDPGRRSVVECETVCWRLREAALLIRWLVARRWRLAEAHAVATRQAADLGDCP